MSERRVDEAAIGETIARVTTDAVIRVSADGTIAAWNPAAERTFGWAADEAVGQSIRLIVPPDHVAEQAALHKRVFAGELIAAFETVRRRKDDTPIGVSMTLCPLTAPDGTVEVIIVIAHDGTERDRSDRASRRLAAIVESSDDAIISKDLNGIVTSWNAAAERMFGYTAAEMTGKSIRTVIPDDRQGEEDEVLAKLRRGDRVDHFETIRRRKDGSLVQISLTVSPIRDATGRVVGASKTARDITALRDAQAERVRLAEENALVTETLNEIGTVVAAGLDRDAIVQAVIDAATDLTSAQYGAFFYNATDDRNETYTLCAVSGAPREAFSQAPALRTENVFGAPFSGIGAVRRDDITADARDGYAIAFQGPAFAAAPMRSYLVVPVRIRSGDIFGGLFFGHPDVGRFSERNERLAIGIASWASVALENARLYVNAQEASRLKDEFLALLSHELRTPLNAILGYARMLRSGLVAADKRQRAIETVERNATSLTQIVADVLDVSRIIQGKMRLNVQVVELPDVLRHSIDAVRPAADAKGIRIETVVDPRATPISGDPDRLQQVFWNLLANAVKFTNKGGRVQVRLERANSHVEVVCSDTGMGIPPEFLPHIFERFRQAEGGISRERSGLGLGLAIARQLVEMHGGTIHASSGGIGTGATFRIKLPLMIVHPADDAGARVHPHSVAAGAEVRIPNLRGVHVVAVDDDRDALSLVREILEVAGATVTTVHSAAEALAKLADAVPDVLVTDLGMPAMDGFEFIARVRRHPNLKLRELPAAALTAYARSEDRVKAMRAGFQMHLAKPIDPQELMTTIAVLAKRGDADD